MSDNSDLALYKFYLYYSECDKPIPKDLRGFAKWWVNATPFWKEVHRNGAIKMKEMVEHGKVKV